MSGGFAALQRSFLYFPLSQEPPPISSALPGAEELRFRTADGIDLVGWFRAPPPDGTTIIVFNGNAGDRSHRAPLATALTGAGFGVLLMDYRGYAGNRGSPSEDGLREDARAALAALRARDDVAADRIAYYGESLGAAVAVQLAAEAPPQALVLRSPFTSLEDMARLHYAWLPISRFLVERYESIGHITRVTSPVLVIAGDRDEIVPADHSRRLYEAAPGPKRYLLIEGADHNDLAFQQRDVIAEIARFVKAAR